MSDFPVDPTPAYNPDEHHDGIADLVRQRLGIEPDPPAEPDPAAPVTIVPSAVEGAPGAPVVAPDDSALTPPDLPPEPAPTEPGFVIAGTASAAAVSSEGSGAIPSPDPSGNLSPDAETQASLNATVDLNRFVEQAYGQGVTPEQVLGVFDFYDRAASAPPAVQQALNALLAGDTDAVARALGLTTPGAAPTAPAAPTTPVIPSDPWDDGPVTPAVDPVVAERLAQVEAQLAAQQQAAYQAEMERAQQQAMAGAEEFAAEWKDLLDPTEQLLIQRRANANVQWINQRAQTLGGDYRAAYKEALETAAYADPSVRDKIVARQAAAVQQEQNADTVRQTRAAALAGGGASPASPLATHAPPAPQSTPKNNLGRVDRNELTNRVAEALRQKANAAN